MSNQLCRGMTWSGTIYNLFAKEPSAQINKDNSNGKTITTTQRTAKAQQVEIENEDLREISNAVAELHAIGTAMGGHLDAQNALLNKIDTKTEQVHSDTLAVTLRASQLTNRNKSVKTRQLGTIQLHDCESGRRLAVNADGFLELVASNDRSTFFDCFEKGENIYALYNKKRLKYLGNTWYGSIRGLGNVFGKQEEVYLDLKEGRETGLFFLSNNFGGGGWLKKASGDETVMTSVTSGMGDRDGAVAFRVRVCDPKLVES